jgi:hypothetical protein
MLLKWILGKIIMIANWVKLPLVGVRKQSLELAMLNLRATFQGTWKTSKTAGTAALLWKRL